MELIMDEKIDWNKLFEEGYKKLNNIPNNKKDELEWYKERVKFLNAYIAKIRFENSSANYQAYMKGWNDAVHKIDNFIDRHCKKWDK